VFVFPNKNEGKKKGGETSAHNCHSQLLTKEVV